MALVSVDEAWDEDKEKAFEASRDGCGGRKGGTARVGMAGIGMEMLSLFFLLEDGKWEDFWEESRAGDGRGEGDGEDDDDITGIVGSDKVIWGTAMGPEVLVVVGGGIRDAEELADGWADKDEDQTDDNMFKDVSDWCGVNFEDAIVFDMID